MGATTVESFKRSDVPSALLGKASLPRLTFFAACDWSVIILSALAMQRTSVFFFPVWILLIAGRIHAFGVLIHDLTHAGLKRKSFTVRVFEVLVGYPIGTTIDAMAYHHIRHHQNTLFENDPYFKINKKCTGIRRVILTLKKGPLFIPFWITRSFVGIFATFIPGIRTFYARTFLQDVSGRDLSQSAEVVRCAREDIPIALFHAAVFLLAVTTFPFLFYCYYAALPVAGTFCIYRLLIEHEYDIQSERSTYALIESTFDHHTHPLERLFIGPRNIGFHCIHHIHPGVGLHHLPALRDWYLAHCPPYADRYRVPTAWNWKQDLFGGINGGVTSPTEPSAD